MLLLILRSCVYIILDRVAERGPQVSTLNPAKQKIEQIEVGIEEDLKHG
jgi:hypothetical protein